MTFLGTRATGIFWFFGFSTTTPVAIATSACSSVMLRINRKRNELTVKEYFYYIFTLMVFWIDGSMGRECHICHSRLAISEKMGLPQSISSNWIQKNVSFWLLKSSLLCLQGSRTVCRKTAQFGIGVDISHTIAKIKLN